MNIDTSTPARRAMHRENTLKQPCYRCEACKSGKPRECVRLVQAGNDSSTGFERAQSALSAKQPGEGDTNWPDPTAKPNPLCGCSECNPRAWWMVVCGICGNKRCPHASDHRFQCSGSNAVGQTPKIGPSCAPAPNVGSSTPKSTHNSGNEPLLAFFVACDPTGSTAQQKGVRIVNGKPMFFTKAKVKKAEQQIARLFAPYAPPEPFEGPLVVEIEFTYPWRKGETKSVKGHWKCRPKDTKPDVENAFKSVGDQMTKLKFWGDDSQISRLVLVKVWADEPGIRVNIYTANPVYR